MAKELNEKPGALNECAQGESAPPPSAAEGLRPQTRPRKRRVRSRKAAKGGPKKQPPEKGERPGPPARAKKSASAKKARPIAPGPRKRVRLAEALRLEGLDERAVAENYVVAVEKLRHGTENVSSAQKALLDVLKECSRILEPPRAPGAASGDTPAVVNLYHNVPRPLRDSRREPGDADPS